MQELVRNLEKIEVVKSRRKKENISYINIPCAFDIETSSFYENGNKRACMYVYAFGIDSYIKLGRTREEFINDVNFLVSYFNLSLSKRLIIYIHNLGYEFQFFRKLFKWEKVFSNEERRPIYALTKNGIEFRCSYYLSNLSLEKVGESLANKNIKKLVGYLDYEKIRTSITPLTEKEKEYVTYDVKVLLEYIKSLIKSENSIANIPLTSTGFVRKYCRSICLNHNSGYRKIIKQLNLTPVTYTLLKQSYSGGFTHASAWYSMKTLNNVSSYDETSAYVGQFASKKFPMSEPLDMSDFVNKNNIDKLLDKFCCLFEITLYDVKSIFLYESFLSKSKCIDIVDCITDNGRVSSAKRLKIVTNEVDFSIIRKVYSFSKFKIGKFFVFYKDYLPKEFLLSVLSLYKDKTELKGVEGQEELYSKKKGQLNASYGMSVTDIVRDEIIYTDFDEWSLEEKNIDEEIEKYNKSKTRFLYYPWGVWVTAYARLALWKGIFELKDDYVYSDTDSLKFLNLEKHKDFFDNYNKNIIKEMSDCLSYHNIPLSYILPQNKYGEIKPLGVWDFEGTYDTFKTLGAKRYLIKKDDKYVLTCAGVSKVNGSQYLVDKYKNEKDIFDNFTDDLIFPSEYIIDNEVKNGNGKKTHTYIDFETKGEVVDYLGNKGKYHELSSIHLSNCDYKISMSDIYLNYLFGLKESFIK